MPDSHPDGFRAISRQTYDILVPEVRNVYSKFSRSVSIAVGSLLVATALCGCVSEAGREISAADDREATLILRYENMLSRQEEEIRALLEAMCRTDGENATGPRSDSEPATDSGRNKEPNRESGTESGKDSDPHPGTETDTLRETDAGQQGFRFTYDETEGGLRITGISGTAETITIPAEIDGKPVTEIADRAFEDSRVRNVTVSEGVRTIGWFAFYGCSSLASVTLPRSVTSIGYSAFDGCAANLTILCYEDSYAQKYASSFAIRWSPPDY